MRNARRIWRRKERRKRNGCVNWASLKGSPAKPRPPRGNPRPSPRAEDRPHRHSRAVISTRQAATATGRRATTSFNTRRAPTGLGLPRRRMRRRCGSPPRRSQALHRRSAAARTFRAKTAGSITLLAQMPLRDRKPCPSLILLLKIGELRAKPSCRPVS